MSVDPDQPTIPTEPAARPGILSREFSIAAIVAWAVQYKFPLILGLGIGLRLIQYGHDRSYWMDEASLVGDIKSMTPASMFGPLGNSQLAPPGFLFAEWAAMRTLGGSRFALRLVPLLSGIASLFLIAAVARRCLPARAVWMAVALFAVSGDLVYFASEAKQYSSDVAWALALILLGLTLGAGALTAATGAILAAAGAAIVWFSHPSIFVLAAVGSVGLARSGWRRDWQSVAWWMFAGLAWVGSFAAVHYVAMEQLNHDSMMWKFWAFAFPPMPPRSAWEATWIPRHVVMLFVVPLNFDGPIGPRLSMLPAIGLCLVGTARLWGADRGRLAILMLPGVFAMLASCLKLYPFHGRLVLFFVPALLLAIADGLDLVREKLGRGVLYWALMAMVLGYPALTAAYHVVDPIDRKYFNPFGDLRPEVIDPYRFPL